MEINPNKSKVLSFTRARVKEPLNYSPGDQKFLKLLPISGNHDTITRRDVARSALYLVVVLFYVFFCVVLCIFVLYLFFVLFYIFLCCSIYCLCCFMYFCVLCIFCVVLRIFVLFYVFLSFFMYFCLVLCIVCLCRSVYCLCVNVYCTTATGWLPNYT
jgi:hypothetical protein